MEHTVPLSHGISGSEKLQEIAFARCRTALASRPEVTDPAHIAVITCGLVARLPASVPTTDERCSRWLSCSWCYLRRGHTSHSSRRTRAVLATSFGALHALAAVSGRFDGLLHEVHRHSHVLRFMAAPGDGLETERSARGSQMSTRAQYARSERDLWPICDRLSAWTVVVSKEPVRLRCEHDVHAVLQKRRQIDRFVVCVLT